MRWSRVLVSGHPAACWDPQDGSKLPVATRRYDFAFLLSHQAASVPEGMRGAITYGVGKSRIVLKYLDGCCALVSPQGIILIRG